MERRSAEIAERRLAREQRQEARFRERAEQLAREEEERRKAEAVEREARLREKRQERLMAKQVMWGLCLRWTWTYTLYSAEHKITKQDAETLCQTNYNFNWPPL